MNFQTAIELKEKNGHLIGKQDEGSTIEELILIPTDNGFADDFLKLYLQDLDGDKAIAPFAGTDVDVVAVFDKEETIEQGIFHYTSIFNLPVNLGVITV